MSRRTVWITLIAGLPLLLAVAAFMLMRQQYQPYGTRLLNSRPLETNQFTLSAAGGQTRSLSDYAGKVVLIFFGFVNCPDICPTAMQDLKKVYLALSPAEQKRLQVLMISVDPERDTPELLQNYLKFFHPSFEGLTGTPEQVAEVAKRYGVFYQKSNIVSATEYNVDHTASIFGLDGKGNLRLLFGNGKAQDTVRMVADVRWLMR